MRLLQHRSEEGRRQVIAAFGDDAAFVDGVDSVRALALQAIESGVGLEVAVRSRGLGAAVDLVEALEAGRLLAPIDHDEPARVTLSGTGLTHLGSAEGRDKMHKAAAAG
ncbi:MAG: FAH family protein, partial [Brevundimonas sp.]